MMGLATAAIEAPNLLHRHTHLLPISSPSPLFRTFFLCSPKKCNLNLQKSVQDASPWKISSKLLKEDQIIDDEACELVNGVEVSLEGEGDDIISAYLFTAVKNNNGTGILLLSDIFGFEDSFTRDFAYRVACNGYNILVPDLFRGNPWKEDQQQLEQWIAGQSRDRIAKDIDTWTKWLVEEFMAAGISKKLGVIGFCFGGGLVLDVLARDQGACFGTGISIYGTRMDHVTASDIKAPVLFILGDSDPLCSVTEIDNIQKKMSNRDSKVVVFPGRGHGFAHRPGSPEEDVDAEQAFVMIRDWLYDNLAA